MGSGWRWFFLSDKVVKQGFHKFAGVGKTTQKEGGEKNNQISAHGSHLILHSNTEICLPLILAKEYGGSKLALSLDTGAALTTAEGTDQIIRTQASVT